MSTPQFFLPLDGLIHFDLPLSTLIHQGALKVKSRWSESGFPVFVSRRSALRSYAVNCATRGRDERQRRRPRMNTNEHETEETRPRTTGRLETQTIEPLRSEPR